MIRLNPAIPEPQPAPPSAAARERRREARQTCVMKAMLFADTMPAAPQRVCLCNVSLLGVGFRTSTPIELGHRYRIKVEAGPMRMTSRLEVRSCRVHEDQKSFDIGAQFIANELTFDDRPNRRATSIPRNPCHDLTPQ